MSNFAPGVDLTKTVFGMLPRQWVWIRVCRTWYFLFQGRAAKRFLSLRDRLSGLLEQEAEGWNNPATLSAVAVELEKLGIRPAAIRGERGRARLREELDYLHGCTEFRSWGGRLSLRMARRRFIIDPAGDLSFMTDSMAIIHDEWLRRSKPEVWPGELGTEVYSNRRASSLRRRLRATFAGR